MAAKTLWNHLAQLRSAIQRQQAEEVISADQLADLLQVLQNLTTEPPATDDEFELYQSEFQPVALQLINHLGACLPWI